MTFFVHTSDLTKETNTLNRNQGLENFYKTIAYNVSNSVSTNKPFFMSSILRDNNGETIYPEAIYSVNGVGKNYQGEIHLFTSVGTIAIIDQ